MDQIGRYKIVAKIGQGGTSHVWKGFDATLNRHVAVKTISADMADDPALKKRFEREAQSAARLNHPHIITIYDFGQEQDKLYMAMELLEGMDLKQAISKGRLKTLDEKLEVVSQICDGLAFAHAHEIVHRDLKPANVQLLPDGQVKIMDFGLARLSGSDMTRTGLVMGTPNYMSPEQVRGEHVDLRSDVFSLGCLFYEILTGQKPFDADSIHSVLYKVMQEEPKAARELLPGLPLVLQQLLEKAMAKKPAERFQNAGEFGDFLERAREAIAAGRGHEALPGLVPPTHAAPDASRLPAVGHPLASAPKPETQHSLSPVRRGERSGSVSRVQSHPKGTPRSYTLWYVLGLAALVLVGVGAYVLQTQKRPADAGGEAGTSRLDALTHDLARKKAQMARNRLEAGDYEDALKRAEDALTYDPTQAEAKEVRAKAQEIRERVEKALAEARPPDAGAPTEAARTAYWDLLLVAPERAEAQDFAATYDPLMRGRADEARRLMEGAQKAATEARGGELEDFKAAERLARDADTAFKGGRFAMASRDFLRARSLFRRAGAVAGGAPR